MSLSDINLTDEHAPWPKSAKACMEETWWRGLDNFSSLYCLIKMNEAASLLFNICGISMSSRAFLLLQPMFSDSYLNVLSCTCLHIHSKWRSAVSKRSVLKLNMCSSWPQWINKPRKLFRRSQKHQHGPLSGSPRAELHSGPAGNHTAHTSISQ